MSPPTSVTKNVLGRTVVQGLFEVEAIGCQCRVSETFRLRDPQARADRVLLIVRSRWRVSIIGSRFGSVLLDWKGRKQRKMDLHGLVEIDALCIGPTRQG